MDAVIAILMGVYRLTKRQVPELMRDFFGLPMSVGAVIGCESLEVVGGKLVDIDDRGVDIVIARLGIVSG